MFSPSDTVVGPIDRLGFKEVIDRYLSPHLPAKGSDAACVVARILNVLPRALAWPHARLIRAALRQVGEPGSPGLAQRPNAQPLAEGIPVASLILSAERVPQLHREPQQRERA